MLSRVLTAAPLQRRGAAVVSTSLFLLRRTFTSTSLVTTAGDEPRPGPLAADTWHWVRELSSPTNRLTVEQAEALLTVIDRITAFRLRSWQRTLPTQTRLHADLNILRTISLALDQQHRTHRASLHAEQRTSLERVSADLHATLDELRDATTAVRTDLSLLVNAFKAEWREDGQRVEMDLHGLEGKLAAGMSLLRSDAEDVKVRSIYTFAFVIFSMLLGAVAERSTRKHRQHTDAEKHGIDVEGDILV